jgi:hypothetical protein
MNKNNVITHYAFHTVNTDSTTRAVKKSKAEAIALLEIKGNVAYTWVWNYAKASWSEEEQVEVVNGSTGKYLRSNRDNKLTDNLQHLIDFDWIAP